MNREKTKTLKLILYSTPCLARRPRVMANYYGLNKDDLKVETFHVSSKVWVKLTHYPSGIVIHCKKHGYRSANRHEAFQQILRKLETQ